MRPKVLWIEDSARFELSNLAGPVYFCGKYDFQQVEDVTTAIKFLNAMTFDVLIVDIRLPPGTDPYWCDLYEDLSTGGSGEKLGIEFLSWLLMKKNTYSLKPPKWINPNLIGVFTVENYQEIYEKLDKLGVKKFKHKSAGMADTALLELIEEVLITTAGSDRKQ